MWTFDQLGGALTSYGIAIVGMVTGTISADNIMWIMGALLMLVRLLYEALRLWRYIHDEGEADD